VDPDLHAHAWRALAQGEQVVADREPLRLRRRQPLEALRRGHVQIAAPGGADVAGDGALAPAEVVGRRDVGQEAEALLVAEVPGRFDEPARLDDERRLAVRLAGLDQPGDFLVAQLATSRSS